MESPRDCDDPLGMDLLRGADGHPLRPRNLGHVEAMNRPELNPDLWVREMAAAMKLPQPLTMLDCAFIEDLLWEARQRGREASKAAQEEFRINRAKKIGDKLRENEVKGESS